MNPSIVAIVARKQRRAIYLAHQSPANIYGLSLEEVRIVCESAKPFCAQDGSVQWNDVAHHQLWESMDRMTLEQLAENFKDEIQDKRLLRDVLGSA